MNKPQKYGRRNVYLPDPLYDRIVRAAANASARAGRTISVSEWLREAAAAKLARKTAEKQKA